MKKSTKMRRIFIAVMAMVMVLGMSTSVFAADGAGDYIVGNAPTYDNPIDVKVVVQSRQYSPTDSAAISEVVNVKVGKEGVSGQTFHVRDAVLALNNGTSGIKACDRNGSPITDTAVYIYSFTQNGKTYAPALPSSSYALDGWMFRVNGKVPLEKIDATTGPLGTTIDTTPIQDGDVIHFYWDYPYNETSSSYYSTEFLTADMSYANNTLSLQLKKSIDYFDNSFYWHISDFTNYSSSETGNFDVTIYDETGTAVKEGTISKSGAGTIGGCNLQSGKTYYVKVDTTSYRDIEDSDYDIWNILKTTMVYEKLIP